MDGTLLNMPYKALRQLRAFPQDARCKLANSEAVVRPLNHNENEANITTLSGSLCKGSLYDPSSITDPNIVDIGLGDL